MSIKSKTFRLFESNEFQASLMLKRKHVVSFNCKGIISYKGCVINVTEGEAITLPKNKLIHCFLYGTGCSTITVYRYYDDVSKVWYSSSMVTDYVNAFTELDQVELANIMFIETALNHYIRLEIARTCRSREYKADLVEKIKRLVIQDLRKDWGVKDVCAQVFLSESSLYRTLRAEKTSFTALIQDIRLVYAKELLVSSRLSIGEISYNSGFNSTSYFGNKFKAKYGMSPTYYRNLSKC